MCWPRTMSSWGNLSRACLAIPRPITTAPFALRVELVVISDDQVETKLFGCLGRVERRNAAIDCQQEFCAGLCEGLYSLGIQAVTFVDAMRNIVIDIGTEES